MKEDNMMYLIIKETKFTDDSMYNVVNFTDNLDKANDMLQGYKLIEKDKSNFYSIIKYETPQIQKEVA